MPQINKIFQLEMFISSIISTLSMKKVFVSPKQGPVKFGRLVHAIFQGPHNFKNLKNLGWTRRLDKHNLSLIIGIVLIGTRNCLKLIDPVYCAKQIDDC